MNHFTRTFALWCAGVFSVYWLAAILYNRVEHTREEHGDVLTGVICVIIAALLTVCLLSLVIAVTLIVRWTWTAL